MNISDQQLEQVLHHAPCPMPPAGLKEKLISHAPLCRSQAQTGIYSRSRCLGRLRRWWPVLIPGLGSVACAIVLSVQQMEVNDLKRSIQNLAAEAAKQPRAQSIVSGQPSVGGEANDLTSTEQMEVDRLRKLARQLEGEIAGLEKLRDENQKLRAKLSGPQILGLSAAETEALEKESERALSIQCVNNLKQFGLAVRIWANDRNDTQPPSIICMSNEMVTPKILVCPADTSRQVASNWAAFTPANCSYEYFVTPETNNLIDPNRVISRCPIHGHAGLADGSVQSVGKNHPDWFVNRNGKVYLEPQRGREPASVPPK